MTQGGFTVTEVMMFLAISGLLLAGAMAGVSANINNSRFNDAVRSTTSYLQGQYDEVASGRNDRDAALSCDSALQIDNSGTVPPGMTDCVILGRFIKLEGTSLTSRYIIGYSQVNFSALPQDDNAALNDPRMRVRVADASTYQSGFDIPWSIAITRSKTPSQTPSTLGLAIVRSPVSGNVMYYTFPAVTGNPSPSLSGTLTTNNLNQNVTICFADESFAPRRGNVVFAPGKGQEVISTDLSATAGDCS